MNMFGVFTVPEVNIFFTLLEHYFGAKQTKIFIHFSIIYQLINKVNHQTIYELEANFNP